MPANNRRANAPSLRSVSVQLKRGAGLAALAIIVLAGGGTLLGFAARHSWRFELACHFRVQYFWALALACLVLALVRWRKLAVVALALAVTNLVLIAPLYFGPAPRADAGPPLRALSFNVHYLNRDYGATLELILTEQPDFVLLLEVTPDWAKALEFLRPDYPFEHVIAQTDSGGIAFYSRHKITDVRVDVLPEVGARTIIAGLESPHGRLTFLGTHPPSPRTDKELAGRNRQLAEVGQLARETAGAVIVMGDLNTTSWSPYFQEMLSESGLLDSRRGFGVGPSWPWFPLAMLRIPIDHCLVSPGVSVLGRWIGPDVGSDHLPLLVEFAFVEP
jgi:endonuclease/exonuclease/phosphatase (EEP) superfamily protein YafD